MVESKYVIIKKFKVKVTPWDKSIFTKWNQKMKKTLEGRWTKCFQKL